MEQALIDSYRTEYEHTDLSKTELCQKYGIKLSKLTGHREWKKKPNIKPTSKPEEPSLVLETDGDRDITAAPLVLDAPQPTLHTPSKLVEKTRLAVTKETQDSHLVLTQDEKQERLKAIEDFKMVAITTASIRLKNEGEYLDTKEIRDLVSVVDTIERSYTSSKDSTTPTSVMVQNIVNNFRDDC